MKFLSKIGRTKSEDDEEDIDLDEESYLDEDIPDEDGTESKGLFSKLFRRGKGGDDSDEDGPSGPDEDSPAQLARLKGVSDVRPVGNSNEGLTPPGESGESTPNSDPGGSPSVPPGAGGPKQADPEDVPEPAGATGGDNNKGGKAGDLEISLKDIFEQEAEVDEGLKDLADSQEDVPAQDLAEGLREFLAELEK